MALLDCRPFELEQAWGAGQSRRVVLLMAVAFLITEAVYLAKAVSKDIGARGEGRSKSEGSSES